MRTGDILNSNNGNLQYFASLRASVYSHYWYSFVLWFAEFWGRKGRKRKKKEKGKLLRQNKFSYFYSYFKG